MSNSRNSRALRDLRDSAPIKRMDMDETAELPAVDDMPRTPAPRRISETDACPAWQAAMEALRRQFCEPEHDPMCFEACCLSRANTPRPVRS